MEKNSCMECGITVREACGCGKSVIGIPRCRDCYFTVLYPIDYPCNDCSGLNNTSKCHFAPKKLGGY